MTDTPRAAITQWRASCPPVNHHACALKHAGTKMPAVLCRPDVPSGRVGWCTTMYCRRCPTFLNCIFGFGSGFWVPPRSSRDNNHELNDARVPAVLGTKATMRGNKGSVQVVVSCKPSVGRFVRFHQDLVPGHPAQPEQAACRRPDSLAPSSFHCPPPPGPHTHMQSMRPTPGVKAPKKTPSLLSEAGQGAGELLPPFICFLWFVLGFVSGASRFEEGQAATVSASGHKGRPTEPVPSLIDRRRRWATPLSCSRRSTHRHRHRQQGECRTGFTAASGGRTSIPRRGAMRTKPLPRLPSP